MNTIIKIENGKIYTESNLHEYKDIFEIVERIPKNFFVWNIGENMGSSEYIPLATQQYPNADKDDCKYYEINRKLLFAIKLPVEEVKLLREAARNGITSKAEAEKALKSKRKGYWSDKKREWAGKTIDIFNKITA